MLVHQRAGRRRVHQRRPLALDETADELAARVAIYRMMRPGEPPTEDAVRPLFNRLFYSTDTYDRRVGRIEVQRPREPR